MDTRALAATLVSLDYQVILGPQGFQVTPASVVKAVIRVSLDSADIQEFQVSQGFLDTQGYQGFLDIVESLANRVIQEYLDTRELVVSQDIVESVAKVAIQEFLATRERRE